MTTMLGANLHSRKTLIHLAFALAGFLGLIALVRGVGVASFVAVLGTTAPFLPALFLLEGLHILAEAGLTYFISPAIRERVPRRALLRIHVVGFAISVIVPAGRATAEATKAAMLTRYIGVPEAAAVGASSQSLSMLGSALLAVPCLIAALVLTGFSAVSGAVLVFALLATGAFAGVQLLCRRRELGSFLVRRFPRIGRAVVAFQEASFGIPMLPPMSVLFTFLNRAIQVVEYALLLFTIGRPHGVLASLLAQGVAFAGGAIADFIPGQVGATDGAFALAAPTLGITAADGVAISVMLHCVQILWAFIGWTVPVWWRESAPREPTAS